MMIRKTTKQKRHLRTIGRVGKSDLRSIERMMPDV